MSRFWNDPHLDPDLPPFTRLEALIIVLTAIAVLAFAVLVS